MRKNNNSILKKIENKIPDKWKKHIPNIITSSRVLMALAFISTFITGHIGVSVVLFATASISDAIDGYLARRWKAQSKFGKYLDPMADKLLVGSTLLLYGLNFNKIMLLPFILELSIAAVNTISVLKNGKSDVNKIGKFKTITLMTTTSLALLSTLLNSQVLNSIIQGLICLNITLQAGALSGYIGQVKKKQENNQETNQNIDLENNDEDIKKEKSNIREKIETLKNEKDFLLSNENESTKSKKRVYKQ